MPFSVHHKVDHPSASRAATKNANELMVHTSSPELTLLRSSQVKCLRPTPR